MFNALHKFTEARLMLTPSGVKIKALDVKERSYVSLALYSESLDPHYHCEGDHNLGIDVQLFQRFFKSLAAEDTIIFQFDELQTDKLCCMVEDKRAERQCGVEMSFLTLKNTLASDYRGDLPSVSPFKLSSAELHEWCKKMQTTKATVVDILATRNRVVFTGAGTLLQRHITVDNLEEDRSDPARGKFALKTLMDFAKCTAIASKVFVTLQNDKPLVLAYQLNGGIGTRHERRHKNIDTDEFFLYRDNVEKENKMENTNTKYEAATADPPIPGQKYVLISFVGPTNSRQRSKETMVKIRYVASSEEDARDMAKAIRSRDPLFDIFVASVGTWLPFVDDPERIDHHVYDDDRLNTMVSEYRNIYRERTRNFLDRVKLETDLIRSQGKRKEENASEEDRDQQYKAAIQMRYSIYKLKTHVDARSAELKALTIKYGDDFPEDVRETVDSIDLPSIDEVSAEHDTPSSS
ncbi:hypothetical protein HDU93_002705 [Gonapodya sp. JEL0774]|nr:hypothetical protein HDU93_002705 [Gonapodya sp. JEL0774]